ncbi:MAG: helix-turn-helix domain-containing protein [Planctomycetota bacterium]|jgi:hypothetical protein
MADDFYTVQEVMEKLRKSEEDVQDLVRQGKLRQYMDAGNPMFKTTDVDSLAEEIVGLDVSSLGIDLAGSELDLNLMETGAGDDLDLVETGEIEDLGASEIELAETSGIEDLAGDSLDLVETGGLEEPQTTEPAPAETAGIEDLGASEISLEETSEIQLDPDSAPESQETPSDEIDPKDQSSEGGFGLSQMGDLTMADTNVGTVGINILSGTEDSFKLTEDTKADTLSADAEAIDELESLDADANMESFGSGSGLLDLSLQADDTSLGAVLDDILPAGAEEAGAGDLPVDQIGMGDEAEDLLAEPAMAEVEPAAAETPAPMATATPASVPGQQMVAVAQVDPRTNLFGIAMFLPLTAIIIVGIILTGAMRGITPSLMKTLTETKIADVGLFWYVLGGLGIFAVLFSLFASLGGGSSAGTKTKKTKAKKEKKPKKAKAPKAKKEKKPKKKKK